MLAVEAAINPQENRSFKRARKAEKKKARRAAASQQDEAYDFSRDFYGEDEGAGGDHEDSEEDDEL